MGFYTVPVCIGVFSIPQIINLFIKNIDYKQPKVRMRNFLPSLKEIWQHKWNILRSSAIGTVIGIVPAIGQTTASFFAYDLAKRSKSTEKEKFGEGNTDGVIAPETANNAVCGGALVPMLTLGIPGDAVTAILIGGLTLQGLRAGPMLFLESYDIVVGLYTCLLLATIFMVLIQLFGIKFFSKILAVPSNFLAPILVVLSMIGCYAVRNNPFDCMVCLVLGTLAYFLDKTGCNLTCIVMGLVLGSTFESEMRRTLIATHNDWTIFLTRPISGVILGLCAVVVVWTAYKQIRTRKGEPEKSCQYED
jgi:putative tricarboxylic transport membrane protein